MKHTQVERISLQKREEKMAEEHQPRNPRWQKQISFQSLKPATELMPVCLERARDEVSEHKFVKTPNVAPLYWPQTF